VKKKTLSVVLFLGTFLIAGALVASFSKQTKRPPAPVAKKEQPAVPVTPPAPPARLNVDFNQVALADVVPFVTENTGKCFVLNGTEGRTISWTEYSIPRERLLESFLGVLSAFDLEAKFVEDRNVYTIEPTPEPGVTVKLDYGTGGKETYLFFGGKMYRQDDFPHPAYRDASGAWYATIPEKFLQGN